MQNTAPSVFECTVLMKVSRLVVRRSARLDYRNARVLLIELSIRDELSSAGCRCSGIHG